MLSKEAFPWRVCKQYADNLRRGDPHTALIDETGGATGVQPSPRWARQTWLILAFVGSDASTSMATASRELLRWTEAKVSSASERRCQYEWRGDLASAIPLDEMGSMEPDSAMLALICQCGCL